MKQIKHLFIPLSIIGLLLLNSCLSSSVTNYSDDARVYSFSLKSDSVPALAKAVFTVDQTNNIIYNVDSLPFNTKQYGKYRAIPVISTYSSAAMFFNDTTYTSGDSIDFRRSQTFKNYAQNGVAYKTYKVDVRVHKVQPDSISWQKRTYPSYSYSETDQKTVYCNNQVMLFVNDGSTVHLFNTTRALTWSADASTNLPATVSLQNIAVLNNILYVVKDGQTVLSSSDGITWTSVTVSSANQLNSLICAYDSKLFAITHDSGNIYYVSTSSDGKTWTNLYAVPTDFPVSNYAATAFTPPTGTTKLLIVGGINSIGSVVNSVYSYMTNSNWINFITELGKGTFLPRKDAAIIWYDNKALLIGGTLTDGSLVKDTISCSRTEGLLWTTSDTLTAFPTTLNYKLRTKTSLVMDKEYRLFVVGGKDANGNFLKEAWVGRKNKLGFGLPAM